MKITPYTDKIVMNWVVCVSLMRFYGCHFHNWRKTTETPQKRRIHVGENKKLEVFFHSPPTKYTYTRTHSTVIT